MAVDEADLALILERIAPLMEAVAADAAERVTYKAQVPTLRPGTVQSLDGVGGSMVTMDGDDAPVAASVIGQSPIQGGRVMVLLVPPQGAFVIGQINGETASPVGSLTLWGGALAAASPAGWLRCDGTEYQRAAYPALSAVIGNNYNSPGAATFRVPDFRGRVPMGAGGYSSGVLPWAEWEAPGHAGGAPFHVLSLDQLPHHEHYLPQNLNATTFAPVPGNGIAGTLSGNYATGGAYGAVNNPFAMIQPSIVVIYIIRAG